MKYMLWLYKAKGISNEERILLHRVFSTAKDVYEAPEDKIQSLSFLTPAKKHILINHQKESPDRMYSELSDRGISFTCLFSSEYPEKLSLIKQRPYGLYYKGDLPSLSKAVAMVGARRCSAYGKKMANDLAEALAKNGIPVISGMARGIDGISQRAALNAGGTTCAVLGCGVDVVYPYEHKELYRDIIANGCVISEFEPGEEPKKSYFPARNRLISGLSDVTVVIEAREKSGSLITADFALSQGRDVYAVPGRITDPLSTGCNKLLSEGAGIIRSPEGFIADILDLPVGNAFVPESDVCETYHLENEEKLVYSVLDFYAEDIEYIVEKTGLSVLEVLRALLSLHDKGLCEECFQNQYIRKT